MKDIELSELTLPEKKAAYDAFSSMFPKEYVSMITDMVVIEGSELTMGRLIEQAVKKDIDMPDEVYNVIYNACLYIQEQSHS